MLRWQQLLIFFYINLPIAAIHLNLYYTDERIGKQPILPQTCLYIEADTLSKKYDETLRFCLSQLPSAYHIEQQPSLPKWTFEQLAEQNVTSEQLYFWSASIDLIERYQFYLNQLSNKTGDLSSARDEYHHCSLPRFGPQCQYVLIYDVFAHASFAESIRNYYQNREQEIFSLTCYTHLPCHRTSSLLCLDWREICDGKIDCLDGGLDEAHCWKLEVNECDEREFRCQNGQCIPKSFHYDRLGEFDCMDLSDEAPTTYTSKLDSCNDRYSPSFRCEDISTHNYEQLRRREDQRADLSMQRMYSKTDFSLSENCSWAFQRLLKVPDEECLEIVQSACPPNIYFPTVPVLFTDIYLVYRREELGNWSSASAPLFYVCSNQSHYAPYFAKYPMTIIDGSKCVHSNSLLDSRLFSKYSTKELQQDVINTLQDILRKSQLSSNYSSSVCHRSSMYQCLNSIKCISRFRLMDTVKDCPYDDDENATITSAIESLRQSYFACYNGRYISPSLVRDGSCQCGYHHHIWCPDEDREITFLKTNIVFQQICDGFVDLMPVLIDGRNESDETECQQWQCDNIYTRCNGILNCLNGADEIDCNRSVPFDCLSEWHRCVSPSTNELVCLSVEQLGDGIIDCLGATDEMDLCGERLQWTSTMILRKTWFYCLNFSSPICTDVSSFCNGFRECQNGEDEQFCAKSRSAEQFLYEFEAPHQNWRVINFQLPEIILNKIDTTFIPSSSLPQPIALTRLRSCHRGLDIDVWLDEQNNRSTTACLCPPAYYGDRCQYQAQRISLTVQFQALAGSWRTPFAIVISLIDDSDRRLIHSYEQLTYLSSRDCGYKFRKYLVYSTQPKDPRRTYAIHIDFYEKVSLKYRGSASLPITFPFLPVHRLSFIVDIPRLREDQTHNCSIRRCDYGRCMRYTNQPIPLTFCRCQSGWTGRYCHIPHACHCSPDSLCVGRSADNRSICVCPIDKFGHRCLLTDTICQKPSNDTCQNGGQCIANHHHRTFFQSFSCICPKNYTGDRCKIADTQLTITFAKDLQLPQSLLFHFIEVTNWRVAGNFTLRATTYRSLPLRQDSITVHWSEPFHLVFTELAHQNYYLTLVQNEYNQSARIARTVASSGRCPNITELFNQTFLGWHLLRRIKYYHLPCQNRSLNLSCFHDEAQLCLCYDFHQQRAANCFLFDHQMKFNCSGQSECENGAQCLQNKADCPTKSLCICPPCFYGQLCQFSTTGFHLSLDGILGYHILPHVRLVDQPLIVKMSFAITILFMTIGLIDGILSLTVFTKKTIREFGCGLYLLFSSITTLSTMFFFGLKYFILLLTQMQILSDRSFFQVQCRSLDFLLQICLSMDQWLNACVAVERTMMVIQGVRFQRNRSVKAVRFVVSILLIATVGSYIHDPVSRRVIEEDNDFDDAKRTWCIVGYSSNLRLYHYAIHIVHIVGPFLINLVSVIILIKVKAQQQGTIDPNKTYKQLLSEQFGALKHLIIAPIILVILTLPRLITTFLSKCMHSSNDAWLYLIGYFISFIPTMLTFVIFVLPSQFYTAEFQNTLRRYRRTIQRYLHLT